MPFEGRGKLVTGDQIGWLVTTGTLLILLFLERRRARARFIRERLLG